MKTALITGASSGIGMELAKIHAVKGDNLVLVARSEGKLNELAADLTNRYKVEITIIAADLSAPEAPKEVYDLVQQKKIQVDYLINNAGFGDFNFVHESDWKKQAMMIDLNIKSLTHLTHLFLPEMVKRKSGKIMNVASTAAFQPCPMMNVYAATKHYVLAFSEALANEVAEHGVTVTALCPGATTSGFQDAAAMHESGFMHTQKFATAASVAAYAYKAMMRGKRVAVHGFMNRVLADSVRFIPRRMATFVARKMVNPRNK